MFESTCREIIEELMRIPLPTKREVDKIKVKVCRKFRVGYPSNSDLIKLLKDHERDKLIPILRLKPVRAISGVNVITVMTKPWPCPKPEPCIYCPGGLEFGTPQAYTDKEPAALRGLQNKYDPYKQVRNRIKQLNSIGHEVSKVELIILGGTFTAMPINYCTNFVKRCLDAINEKEAESFEGAMKLAEKSRIRNVGITVETRPDFLQERQVDNLIGLGVTRVEIGVQTIYNDIYKMINREHTIEDVVEATRILKDSGFKIVYHIMPNLFSCYERDLEMFESLFNNDQFKPDAIKIYPALVLKGTKLYDLWIKGKYEPYPTTQVIDLLVEVKSKIPNWVRIQRIQRDIPSNIIVAGVKASNLRQIIQNKLRQKGIQCKCIRCREVGHKMLKDQNISNPKDVELMIMTKKASDGEDIFISFEDQRNDVLIGHLRLRVPSEHAHRSEVMSKPSSIVRELHIYGPMVPVGKTESYAWQHKGYGKKLMLEAERISVEDYDINKIIVLSALGTKQYYMKSGYKRDGPYMSKMLG